MISAVVITVIIALALFAAAVGLWRAAQSPGVKGPPAAGRPCRDTEVARGSRNHLHPSYRPVMLRSTTRGISSQTHRPRRCCGSRRTRMPPSSPGTTPACPRDRRRRNTPVQHFCWDLSRSRRNAPTTFSMAVRPGKPALTSPAPSPRWPHALADDVPQFPRFKAWCRSRNSPDRRRLRQPARRPVPRRASPSASRRH